MGLRVVWVGRRESRRSSPAAWPELDSSLVEMPSDRAGGAAEFDGDGLERSPGLVELDGQLKLVRAPFRAWMHSVALEMSRDGRAMDPELIS